MNTIKLTEFLKFSSDLLKGVANNPQLEARLIIADVLKIDRLNFISKPDLLMSKDQIKIIATHIRKRRAGQPLSLILGEKEFFSLNFKVNQYVLTPRPESEFLVERGIYHLEKMQSQKEKLKALDLGTGSGALACALASESAKKKINLAITASDVCELALKTAKENACRLNISDQISFVLSDWFSNIDEKFDLILCNPPYLMEKSTVGVETLYEPIKALYAGKDGLDAYRLIVKNLRNCLEDSGVFVGEFDPTAKGKLLELAEACQLKCSLFGETEPTSRFIEINL
ncbi:MAG TPA: peptide chain release factor N(5)-glutamine methyltransferase [Oligoflexia bacterium]|nr:peptide chain release factor N(5)-glutamine methyltransferase [Oligoflexia bacterium]HMP27602.1 peptide chain release factor N(5)-glutamine methyltransferase [Oligoflexia bacterium]